ncbi:PREDICTED: probable E3 ubiquitin-protein ligase HIP1 [Nelumbo nucifera]|uniref:RING-type E3 ubiquitin transferase n=2 Tax=Nelumbo nucifera TaxID=4432 RepID=A0A1U7ZP61_NELNU|nr:PREDICTED: probable E3 ubiquitin-protein ligase HIP1 [Nelumbo nucifera]XP_010253615.1 PREDICTED: probable E3 ubiquitin-protein ligase HIP1 [Nelumbo nucifera]XP_010253616.1 PREDICTED: probable E3 ubiquitin-protein ligase HIP1 [Nelumbo nucifera]XP_010253617.1 PREDICTED: probable E3 ubiquitin-protein ligase HIP1 [Nelumbo nucifera]XP_010253618.1 PREDICTED: probable E3 ubiquitin-protein ligase HIP1 [Nelumbo nucifera]XP_010253619.1 PREDICTED: probable E3 ubiquitin-protein ligase HIP1 [Nelumbo nuc
MGHRHIYGTSQTFEMDHDQNWNHMHIEQPYIHLGRASASENGSYAFPVENLPTGVANFTSHLNSSLRSNEYSSSSLSMETLHRPAISGPSYDPFPHPSVAGSVCPIPQNYPHHASSSGYYRHATHGIEPGTLSPNMGNGRGSCKRKSPAISIACERDGSRHYGSGSSSGLSISSGLQQEKPNLLAQHLPREPVGITSYRSSNLSIASEGSQRNVRSRSALNLEANIARTHLSSNTSHYPHSTACLVDHSGTMDLTGFSSSAGATNWEWNNLPVCPTAHGRIVSSDTSGLGHDVNQFLGSHTTNGPIELGRYHRDSILSRNSVVPPQSLHGTITQAARGRRGYSQRAMPTYSAGSSYPRLGYATASEDSLQLTPETYSARHSRPPSTVGWRNTDRNGRSRISHERLRSLSDDGDAHDRMVSEGLMMVGRSTLYGSRNLFDQHREMRLDIDNMTYEELLALGERIGNVSTGLSQDMISKCLIEMIYCSSDENQDEGTCVICLEEYKNKEEVGTLKNCRHDYHVSCIKKWLSIKNVCPICKAPALPDNLKEK